MHQPEKCAVAQAEPGREPFGQVAGPVALAAAPAPVGIGEAQQLALGTAHDPGQLVDGIDELGIAAPLDDVSE